MKEQKKPESFDEYLESYKSYFPSLKLSPEQIEHKRKDFEGIKIRNIEQNYFEPYQKEETEYDSILKDLLKLKLPSENEIILIITPSFKIEYGFCITKSKISKHILSESLWEKHYNKENIEPIKLNIKETHIETEMGNILFQVLDKAFNTAKTPDAKFITLDGTVFSLSKKAGNEIITIFKHSPNEDSWTDRTLKVISNIAEGSGFDKKIVQKELQSLLKYKH